MVNPSIENKEPQDMTNEIKGPLDLGISQTLPQNTPIILKNEWEHKTISYQTSGALPPKERLMEELEKAALSENVGHTPPTLSKDDPSCTTIAVDLSKELLDANNDWFDSDPEEADQSFSNIQSEHSSTPSEIIKDSETTSNNTNLTNDFSIMHESTTSESTNSSEANDDWFNDDSIKEGNNVNTSGDSNPSDINTSGMILGNISQQEIESSNGLSVPNLNETTTKSLHQSVSNQASNIDNNDQTSKTKDLANNQTTSKSGSSSATQASISKPTTQLAHPHSLQEAKEIQNIAKNTFKTIVHAKQLSQTSLDSSTFLTKSGVAADIKAGIHTIDELISKDSKAQTALNRRLEDFADMEFDPGDTTQCIDLAAKIHLSNQILGASIHKKDMPAPFGMDFQEGACRVFVSRQPHAVIIQNYENEKNPEELLRKALAHAPTEELQREILDAIDEKTYVGIPFDSLSAVVSTSQKILDTILSDIQDGQQVQSSDQHGDAVPSSQTHVEQTSLTVQKSAVAETQFHSMEQHIADTLAHKVDDMQVVAAVLAAKEALFSHSNVVEKDADFGRVLVSGAVTLIELTDDKNIEAIKNSAEWKEQIRDGSAIVYAKSMIETEEYKKLLAKEQQWYLTGHVVISDISLNVQKGIIRDSSQIAINLQKFGKSRHAAEQIVKAFKQKQLEGNIKAQQAALLRILNHMQISVTKTLGGNIKQAPGIPAVIELDQGVDEVNFFIQLQQENPDLYTSLMQNGYQCYSYELLNDSEFQRFCSLFDQEVERIFQAYGDKHIENDKPVAKKTFVENRAVSANTIINERISSKQEPAEQTHITKNDNKVFQEILRSQRESAKEKDYFQKLEIEKNEAADLKRKEDMEKHAEQLQKQLTLAIESVHKILEPLLEARKGFDDTLARQKSELS